MNATPRVVDNDSDEITVTLDGKEIRGWSYECDIERCWKMRMAREFCEGWFQGGDRREKALTIALNALEGLSYIHDGNPSDAMADMPPLDYARHMLFEARQMAKAAHREAREAMGE